MDMGSTSRVKFRKGDTDVSSRSLRTVTFAIRWRRCGRMMDRVGAAWVAARVRTPGIGG